MVASDAVSNTQLPEQVDASVTIIAKTLLVGLRGSLTPLADRDAFPDWLIPNLPNRIDNIPYEDDDED